MPSSTLSTQQELDGVLGEFIYLIMLFAFFFVVKSYRSFAYVLWFLVWYFYGISVCANVFVSASTCVSCAFSMSLLFPVCLFYSNLVCFLSCITIVIFRCLFRFFSLIFLKLILWELHTMQPFPPISQPSAFHVHSPLLEPPRQSKIKTNQNKTKQKHFTVSSFPVLH